MAIRDKDIYKGRQKSRRLPKTIVIVALSLIALSAALFFGLRHYAVYDENGNATIVFPWSQSGETPVGMPIDKDELGD